MINMDLITILLSTGIIIYFIFNMSAYMVYRTSIYRQIRIYYKSKPAWSKLITNNWCYSNSLIFDALTIMKLNTNEYQFLLELNNNRTGRYINGYIYLDKQGNILDEKISDSMNFWDAHE